MSFSRAENVSNFVKVDSLFGPDVWLVYKTFATLYFVFIFDNSENELAMLDLMQEGEIRVALWCGHQLEDIVAATKFRVMQVLALFNIEYRSVFVETLDKCFSNVCELDVVFNFKKVHTILDEIILGGQVLETSSSEVVKAVEEISKMESNGNSIISSIPGWQGR
ncbi:hypothetical protein DH2020_023814 [Rehmannia glutinosa]|uniref:AP complex subunit sigma n=1 Tax=Rehmannia glutinosa TaxID=99300 RepID=A0ABR0W739_REHGL